MFMKRVLGLGMVYSCLFSFPYDIYFFPCYSFFCRVIFLSPCSTML